jgi:sulfide dehydrogenase [flavocytochrome c] flavoprotein chain
MKRRDFMKAVASGSTIPVVSNFVTSPAEAATYSVGVVGGGMAGATAAKYLRYWASKLGLSVTVTIFEPNANYISNIKSNEVLVATDPLKAISGLTFKYDNLKTKYGVKVTKSGISRVDPNTGEIFSIANSVETSLGKFDAVILAAGIDFDYGDISIDNKTTIRNEIAVPHAWQAGPTGEQLTALRSQLRNLTDGKEVVISIPLSPYRCPPGPYERACVIADWLKRYKPKSRVTIFDANPEIQAERPVFEYAFNTVHAGYIRYVPNMYVRKVVVSDSKTKLVTPFMRQSGAWVEQATITAEVVNIIPPMKAPSIVLKTLADNLDASGRWAKISEQTYQSAGFSRIFVIGDGISSKQPKAGHIGNQEAKVCADAILRRFMGVAPYPTPVTNSACFTPITTTEGFTRTATASWLTALYRYNASTSTVDHIASSPAGGFGPAWPVSGKPSQGLYSDMNKWFKTLMEDTFA